MGDRSGDGDSITVGDVTSSQGVAVGRHAQSRVTGDNTAGSVRIVAGELRDALGELYDVLSDSGLSRDQRIEAQTATGSALNGVTDEGVDAQTVTSGLERVGETLRRANVAVEEGTTLATSIARIAALLGPLVGGARVIGNLFGFPL
jgi:hypothetical protein